MDYKSKLDLHKLPRHVAIIMDGNGRWAKEKGKPRIFGHKNGVQSVRDATEAAAEIGVKYMTLYAFSTENWNRPKLEVTALMSLLVETINREISTMMENNIQLKAIGNLKVLPSRTYKALMEGIEKTKNNSRMTLVLALNYGAREEIINATKSILSDIQLGNLKAEELNDQLFSSYLSTKDIPDPELMIRTSGEHRVSNFLLWQLAYTEFYFTDDFWPDFRKENLYKAIWDYQQRERRFGKTSEQVV